MNILKISYIYPKKINPSQGIFVHQQAKYLVKAGNNVDIITTRSKGDKKYEVWDNVKIHRVASIDHIKFVAGFLFIFGTIIKFLEINKKTNINLVIGEFLGSVTIVIGLLLKVLKKKFVVISHGTKWEISKNWISKILIKLALVFPEKIFCVSKKTKELLSINTNLKKLHVINDGMDPEYLKPSISTSQFRKKFGNKKIILSVSNLVYKKGLEFIIEAVVSLHKKYPNFVYLMVGEGYQRQTFEKMVKDLKAQGFIKIVGRKVGRDLANYYNACDLFVLMSRTFRGEIESFGIVYLEAAYFGKPVIGGLSGGTSDAVENGKTGLLINPKDTEKLEKTILLMLKNTKLRNKLGAAGKKRVLKSFLWKHNVTKLLKLVK
jgi:glycosyltransferase involved in cell wall biosynthesis